jgi:hypothetical protein
MGKEKAQRRLIALPFSSGCRSQSSVDVVAHAGKKPEGAWLRANRRPLCFYSMHRYCRLVSSTTN